MRYYGLHFTSDDHVPVQVRINTDTQEVWARTAPRGGEWTGWRRLDVVRNPDGTLDEEVAEATHAKKADTAGRLAKPFTITFTGHVSGEVRLDGSGDVSVSLTVNQLSSILSRLNELEARPVYTGDNNDYGYN